MKKYFYFLMVLFFLGSCEVERVPETEQTEFPGFDVSGEENPNAPVVVFKAGIPSYVCPQGGGTPITPDLIAVKLREEGFLEIRSANQKHTGAFVISVPDFTIPEHTHGKYKISFTVTDSTGLSTTKELTINILPGTDPGKITVSLREGVTEIPIRFGVHPRVYINDLLDQYFTVTNTNGCADVSDYSLSLDSVISTVSINSENYPVYFQADAVGTITNFKIRDVNNIESTAIDSIAVRTGRNEIPPVVTLPDAETIVFSQTYSLTPYAENDSSLKSDLMAFMAKSGNLQSPDPTLTWDNLTVTYNPIPDRTKGGIQRVYCTFADPQGLASEPVMVRFSYELAEDVDWKTMKNLLRDPGFEEEAAAFIGSGGDDFTQYRISQAWTITPTHIYLKQTTSEGGAGALSGAEFMKAATGEAADIAQGPVLLNSSQGWLNGKTLQDNGYTDVASKNHMSDLPKDDMKHRLIYKATEKKAEGLYSLALRGKSYQPVKGGSLFLGTGIRLTQNIALKAGKGYIIASSIIRSFGRNESGNLDGMVGGIYISLKADAQVLSEIKIVGHGDTSKYGQFVHYVAEQSYLTESDVEAVFEINRYLSNDTGGKQDEDSTWGYSPVYIDNCGVYEIDLHKPESEQEIPAGIQNEEVVE